MAAVAGLIFPAEFSVCCRLTLARARSTTDVYFPVSLRSASRRFFQVRNSVWISGHFAPGLHLCLTHPMANSFSSEYMTLTSGIFINASTICPSNVAMSSCNNSCALITISTVMFSHVPNLTRTAFCTSRDSLSKLTFIGSDSGSIGTKEADSSSQRFSSIYSVSQELMAGRGMPGLSSQTRNL
ncbi:hypothetical protein BvCmsF63A_04845 [Escherichia coli]|nr:hypothetical protein BvCmsF63A_04845 [Escherichia coli]